MGVIDTKHGVRVALERDGERRYVGSVQSDETRYGVAFEWRDDLQVELVASDAPQALAERARLVLRSALKAAHGEGLAPPRRITRWRPAR